jgi:hypothetical protein
MCLHKLMVIKKIGCLKLPRHAFLQLPIGVGKNFEGVVDLVEMKAYRVEGTAVTVLLSVFVRNVQHW